MKFIKYISLIVVSFINSIGVMAQNNYPTCINPELINFPSGIINEDSREIYYQPEDVYTFWYKVNITSNCSLMFELLSVNNEDIYDLIIYKYNGENICNDIVQKNEPPLLNKSKGSISAKKGETYYISVLHLNGVGCGHILTLTTQNKESKIKAIHHDCVEDALGSIVEHDSMPEVDPIVEALIIENRELIDTLESIDIAKKIDRFRGVVVNKNSQKQIEAELSISNLSGTLLDKVNSTVSDGFGILNLNENKVMVSINHFGYEPYIDTIDVDTTQIKIELNPIKVGEKIIMHKIYFHPNTYALKMESTKELLKLNKFMLENSQYSFEIQGHTSGNKAVKKSRGYENLGKEWNFTGTAKKLSKLRAEKIKEYLVKNGVKEEQIQTVGYGGDRMIIEKPKNMKQAMQNIRVEIIVIK
ncbi:MAG: OmpA family protein [Flavobacteriales bacterium]